MSRVSPEKSKFAQTCNLLSHYVKEKGSLRDLNIGINGEGDTSFVCKPAGQVSPQPMNLFPQYASSTQDAIRITSFREQTETKPKHGQMTIIYAGQVLVFDDFSAVKAKELMQIASKSVTPSSTSTGFVIPSNASKLVENNNSVPFASNIGSISGSVQAKNEIKLQTQPIGLDLPIARRASLHRFLSKRKDRASERGPYQLHKPSAESPKELFDLNL